MNAISAVNTINTTDAINTTKRKKTEDGLCFKSYIMSSPSIRLIPSVFAQ
jgi:hypothetical protein